MACGCSKRKQVTAGGETAGYRVTLPTGEQVPPEAEAPFFSVTEAKVVVRQFGGGTIRRVIK